MSLEALRDSIQNERLDPTPHMEWAAAEIERLQAALSRYEPPIVEGRKAGFSTLQRLEG